jgi:hypothetical protein
MIEKIVSGGQTGADRAALDWAISRSIPHGGWCPKGRLAEDGTIPACYNLREMTTKAYEERTEQNVIDSDGTVIFTVEPTLKSGSKKTAEFAVKHNKPLLHLHTSELQPAEKLSAFIAEYQIKTLNVAGPRASEEPTIGEFMRRVLDAAFWERVS